MKRILISFVLLLIAGGMASATPYQVEKQNVKNDVQLWIAAEKYINDRMARDDIRQLAQSYTNTGISLDEPSGFFKQRGLLELRTKMSYYAKQAGYKIPTLRIK